MYRQEKVQFVLQDRPGLKSSEKTFPGDCEGLPLNAPATQDALYTCREDSGPVQRYMLRVGVVLLMLKSVWGSPSHLSSQTKGRSSSFPDVVTCAISRAVFVPPGS